MTYSVKLSKNAEKFLDKLPKNIALRILNKLEEIKDNPFRYLEYYE